MAHFSAMEALAFESDLHAAAVRRRTARAARLNVEQLGRYARARQRRRDVLGALQRQRLVQRWRSPMGSA